MKDTLCLSHLVEHVHDLLVIALQKLVTRLQVFGMQHGEHAVPQRAKHVLPAIATEHRRR